MRKLERVYPWAVTIAMHFKCECGHEWDYAQYGCWDLIAQIEGGCDTCESATWVLRCPTCHGEMRP